MKIVATIKESAIDDLLSTSQRMYWSKMLVNALVEHVGKVVITYSNYLPSSNNPDYARYVPIYLVNTRYKRYRDYTVSVKSSWLDFTIPKKNIYEVSK